MSRQRSKKKMALSLDDISVSSTVSQWSASFKAHFPWLPPLAAANSPDSTSSSSQKKKQQEKELEIVACLYAGKDESVDLWELRQLALSKGGLLSSHLRKRAWPKLVGAHDAVLHHAAVIPAAQQQQQVGISKSNVVMLKRDVSNSVWNVEEHVLMSRYHNAEQVLAAKRNKRVTFSDATTTLPGLARTNSSGDSPPPPIGSIHVVQEEQEDEDNNVLSPPDGTLSPTSQVTMDTAFNTTTNSIRPARASRQEQKILFNTIVSVLRTPPPNGDTEEDEHYFYYHGLVDVTALLLINLESPSLTNLVLSRLAAHSLRDALRNPKSRSMERMIDVSLMELLSKVDPTLHQHITACVEIPSFCLSWIQCWFAKDLCDVRVASRVLDVLLASHALMPIYLSVAMMCHPVHRSRILHTECDVKSMHSVLRNLPKDTCDDEDDDDELLEEMIQSAIGYMRSYPPHKLVPNPPQNLSAFSTPPEWATASSAPTDYALLQYAKQLRKGETTSPRPDLTSSSSTQHLYPLAMAASGLRGQRNVLKTILKAMGVLVLLVVLLAAVLEQQGLNARNHRAAAKKPLARRNQAIAQSPLPYPSPFLMPAPKEPAAAVWKVPVTTSSPSTTALSTLSALLVSMQHHARLALALVQDSAIVRILVDLKVTETVKHWWQAIRSFSGHVVGTVMNSLLPQSNETAQHKFGEFLL